MEKCRNASLVIIRNLGSHEKDNEPEVFVTYNALLIGFITQRTFHTGVSQHISKQAYVLFGSKQSSTLGKEITKKDDHALSNEQFISRKFQVGPYFLRILNTNSN